MSFCWSTLRVKNLEESIRFYADVIGLEVVSKFSAGPGVEIAFLGKGETKIELICVGESRDTIVGNDISWGFEVESLDKMLVLVKEKGIFQQKFFTTPKTRMCLLDLEDLAEAVSIIITNPGYTGATYELCGAENLSLSDMLAAMEVHFGREIKVETPQDEMFAAQLKKHGAGDYQVDTLIKMFQHYNEHGFNGNPNVLGWILGRKPNDFSSFILRTLKSKI